MGSHEWSFPSFIHFFDILESDLPRILSSGGFETDLYAKFGFVVRSKKPVSVSTGTGSGTDSGSG
jgi:hypothetical protein